MSAVRNPRPMPIAAYCKPMRPIAEAGYTPSDDLDEDFVPCLWCNEIVPAEMAKCTDSGWVCETCLENM